MVGKNKNSNGDLYQDLRRLWKQANPTLTAKINEEHFLAWWQTNKSDRDALDKRMNEMKLRIARRGKPILQAFYNLTKDKIITVSESVPSESVPEPEEHVADNKDAEPVKVDSKEATKRDTPAQRKTQDEILTAEKELTALLLLKDSGFLSPDKYSRIHHLKKITKEKTHHLKRLKSQQNYSLKHRDKLKSAIHRLEETHPEAAEALKKTVNPAVVGQPRLEVNQEGLMDSILNIVKYNGTADERRRSDTLRSVKTLDQLLQQLRDQGFRISRSALYLRLLPRNSTTIEGKRHTVTVPVRLLRAQNTARKVHQDTHFAAATIQYLKNLAVMFGEKSVCVISQDDKAKVPLGLPAAKKQAPILMRMEYRVQLPDHDFVVAGGHKLIPSVYAGLQIQDGKVTYSGPTYIAIRSGKHDSSTAPRHADDLLRLLLLDEFKKICRFTTTSPVESEPSEEPAPTLATQNTVPDDVKPIWILLVDGGPDEGPRYPKTLKFAAANFVKLNLDAIFLGTHAPGQSASNPVERRMAPLSRDLCGLILPHQSFGNHLNSSGKTVDLELEKKNFRKAGEVLADVWSERIIDGFPVIAEYVHPSSNTRSKITGDKPNFENVESNETVQGADSEAAEPVMSFISTESFSAGRAEDEDFTMTEIWKSRHVRQSQYLLQIVKCDDVTCCQPAKTNFRQFLKDQFIPAPIPVVKTYAGLKLASLEDKNYHFQDLLGRLASEFLLDAPLKCFDKYCPSSQVKIKDADYNCQCGMYFVTKEALKSHKKVHYNTAATLEVEDDDDSRNEVVVDDGIVFIDNIDQWLRPIFIEEQPESVLS